MVKRPWYWNFQSCRYPEIIKSAAGFYYWSTIKITFFSWPKPLKSIIILTFAVAAVQLHFYLFSDKKLWTEFFENHHNIIRRTHRLNFQILLLPLKLFYSHGDNDIDIIERNIMLIICIPAKRALTINLKTSPANRWRFLSAC